MEEGTEDNDDCDDTSLCFFSFPLLIINGLGLYATPLVRFIFLYLRGFIA